MNEPVIEIDGVDKTYRFFRLSDVRLRLEPGQIMGFVGPNGAGKSTTIRILMAMVRPERGRVRVLGRELPREQAAAKRDIGFVSEDMRLHGNATLGWHMRFVASIYPEWDAKYAGALLVRFNLQPDQQISHLSHGERVKATLLLVLARRPRLLLLDEPTTGLDPVARHEILAELMDVVRDERRAILFSSHNTQDIEQVSDVIIFIDRGRIIDASDKEAFLDRWRRLHLESPAGGALPHPAGVVETTTSGSIAVVATNAYTPELDGIYERAGIAVRTVQRMTVRQLIFKDLYLLRWMMIGAIGAGIAAIAIMPLNQISSYVGGVSLLCTLIVLNIFLVMNGVAQEKKDKVILFILSQAEAGRQGGSRGERTADRIGQPSARPACD